jgi:hypothetical protein
MKRIGTIVFLICVIGGRGSAQQAEQGSIRDANTTSPVTDTSESSEGISSERISTVRHDGDDVQQLITVMTSPTESWETRVDAERKLETLSAHTVLENLLPHVSKPMPEGPIYNSGGRERDKFASVPWQIHYASGRVWCHHKRDKSVAPTLIKLMKKAETRHGKASILTAMQFCWVPEMEETVAEILLNPSDDDMNRYTAACTLAGRKLASREFGQYLPTIFERARSIEAGQQNFWLQLLISTRVKSKAGVSTSATELAFEHLEAQRKRNVDLAYGTARRLEDYLDQKFVPNDMTREDAGYRSTTVENARRWWQQNR